MEKLNVTGFDAEENTQDQSETAAPVREFTIRKSAWQAVDAPKLLLIILPFIVGIFLAVRLHSAIPLIALLFTAGGVAWLWLHIFLLKYEYITIRGKNAEFHKGFFNTQQHSDVFVGVKHVSVDRNFLGNLLGYGTVTVNFIGMPDVTITFVASPADTEAFFRTLIVKPKNDIKRISFGN